VRTRRFGRIVAAALPPPSAEAEGREDRRHSVRLKAGSPANRAAQRWLKAGAALGCLTGEDDC